MTGVVAVLASGGGFRAFATPEIASGVRAGNGFVTSNSVFVSVVPAAPYSVSWSISSGPAVANSPSSTSTTFSGTVVVGEPSESVALATVTVSGQIVGSVVVPVSLSAI